MSLPVEADFAIIKIGDGATPTEVFTAACGIQDVNLNFAANTQDKFTRDCASPGNKPVRTVKVTGTQLDISGTGLIDKAQITAFQAALGDKKNYKIELYIDDDTSSGDLLGTVAGNFVMTAHNVGVPTSGDSTHEISLANNGPWTWTAAP